MCHFLDRSNPLSVISFHDYHIVLTVSTGKFFLTSSMNNTVTLGTLELKMQMPGLKE